MASKTIKVRAPHVPHYIYYLTKGQIYEAQQDDNHEEGYWITSDTGERIMILTEQECAHIDGHWEVIE